MGHKALIFWLQADFDLRGLHARFEAPSYTGAILCHCWSLIWKFQWWPLWPWKWGQGHWWSDRLLTPMRAFDHVNIMSVPLILFEKQPFVFPIGLTLGRWTLAHKSEVMGHSDLILWLQRDIVLRCLHARFEAPSFTGAILCHCWSLIWKFQLWPLWPWKWGQGHWWSDRLLTPMRAFDHVNIMSVTLILFEK